MSVMKMACGAYDTPHTYISVKDPYSALTHFIGIVYSGLLAPFLLIHAICKKSDTVSLMAIGIFLISMVLLYSASTIYHTFDIGDHANRIMKKLDHCMIFILIAGTYTPVCLIPLRDAGGPELLMFVWGFAIAGIIFKLCWVTCPKWVSSVIYIGMGWSCIFMLPSLIRIMSAGAFFWLLIGGLLYTAGGVIYALKLKSFNARSPEFDSHAVFHVFVMAGNLAQYVCVWMLV